MKRLLVMVATAFCFSNAMAGAIIGATEITQILNNFQLAASYAEQAQQTATQIQQYQAMLQNLKQMTPSNLLDQSAQKLFTDQNMMQTFKNLQNVVIAGQQTSYSLANIDSRFKQAYPGYGGGADFSKSYKDWSGNTLGSVKNALSLITAHSENFSSEEGMVNELKNKSQTAQGQLEVTQAGNQVSLAMVGQMQQLRQLQMAQARVQADYVAGQQSKTDHQQEGYDKIFGGLTSTRLKSQ
ncbi:P-type conjugative transfer protein TrbJ [Undibacterium arcticum]|uniref:P-type conjugative transfer protein TrbJ n=1 Tax=Undibacterium arcticum TaxID=1762892 RepID=A0ABV7F774_9BURK